MTPNPNYLLEKTNITLPLIGLYDATDMAMRQYFPPEIMAFTATKSMYERLCKIDKNSFLEKGFIKNLKKARDIA